MFLNAYYCWNNKHKDYDLGNSGHDLQYDIMFDNGMHVIANSYI